MTKKRGSSRQLKAGSAESKRREQEVIAMRESGEYSSVEMGKNGGYLAIEKGKAKHKPEEIEAGRILADKGYKVILKDETGEITTPDGYIFSSTFEQRTPTKDAPNTIRNALFHARDKKADIAVIYSKGHIFSRKSVEEGLKMYEAATSYRFKEIIVVSDTGRVHIHIHK